MLSKLTKARRIRRGFTLIELLVVVLILAILMAVALPLYLSAVADSEKKTCRANMQTIANAEQAFKVRDAKHQYTETLTDLEPDLQAVPKCPNAGTYSVKKDENGTGTFTVHCSIADHDAAPVSGEPAGYTPGKNSQ